IRRMAGGDGCGGRDARRVHELHLIGVREDVAELLRKEVELRDVEVEVGERRNCGDLFSCETRGHAEFYNVPMTAIRRAAVAGSWYPGQASALASAVDGYLENATSDMNGDLVALAAPHAGLKYSGSVAAHAYRLLRGRRFD